MASVGRIIATLGLAMALGGCVTYSEADSYVNDVRGALHRSAENGPVQVTLIGNPFTGSGAKLAGMVRGAMDHHLDWLQANVIIVPAGAAGDRILFVIDPLPVRHTRDICDDATGVPFERDATVMRIGAIYCTEKVVSEVWARLDRPASAGDPVLAEAIDGLAWRVIPWVTKDQLEMLRDASDS
jgi:hypothetical protein